MGLSKHANYNTYDYVGKIVAELYIYLLPIRMIVQLSGIKILFQGAANYLDFVFHVLGMAIIFITYKGKIYIYGDKASFLMKRFFQLILFLNISSFVMAIIMQLEYGSYAGETAFSGILGMLIYFFQYAAIFFYNKKVFQIISQKRIEQIIAKLIFGLMVIGYVQIAVMLFGGVVNTLYRRLDILGILADVQKVGKLCLTGTEGASAGTLISVLVLPFLYSQILTKEKIGTYVLQLILWIPIILFTKSSTGYILFAISLFVFSVFLVKTGRVSNILFIILVIFAIIVVLISLFPEFLKKMLPESFNVQYLLIEKVMDLSNGSTASRTVPFLLNWGAFKEKPLLGVGNGLQGYFYTKYFPSWGYSVAGSDILDFLKIAKNTIANGAVFIPSLLSGYGIVGVGLIVAWVKSYLSYANQNKAILGKFYYMFIFAAISFFISGLQGDMYGKYYVWFMLSLPFMAAGDSYENMKNVLKNNNLGE